MFGDAFSRNEDRTAFDIGCRALTIIQTEPLTPKAGREIAADLERVAPDSPLYMAAKIKSDWPAAEPHVKQWLEATGMHPTVTLALAEHYDDAHDSEHATPMYDAYLAVSPDTAIYRRLAAHSRDANNQTRWLKTVDEGKSCSRQSERNKNLGVPSRQPRLPRHRTARSHLRHNPPAFRIVHQ